MIAGLGLEIVVFRYQGEAYEFLQALGDGAVAHFDLIPTAPATVVLLSTSTETTPQKRLNALRHLWIPRVSEPLADAFLGLVNAPVDDSLVIFESDWADALFAAATKLEECGAAVFDLRIYRGSHPGGYVLAAGGQLGMQKFSELEGRITVIERPNAAVRELFDPPREN